MLRLLFVVLVSVLLLIVGAGAIAGGVYIYYIYEKPRISWIIIAVGCFYMIVGMFGCGLKKIFCGLGTIVHCALLALCTVAQIATFIWIVKFTASFINFIKKHEPQVSYGDQVHTIVDVSRWVEEQIVWFKVGTGTLAAIELVTVIIIAVGEARKGSSSRRSRPRENDSNDTLYA